MGVHLGREKEIDLDTKKGSPGVQKDVGGMVPERDVNKLRTQSR